MVELLESKKHHYYDLSNLDTLIGYEIYMEILSKLRASQHNDKSIRFSLVQTKVFLYILNIYATLGDYEMANANILKGKIQEEIYKKVKNINH